MHKPSLHLLLYGIVFFVFFQLITGLVEATYTFGLLEVDIPPEILFASFLLTPLFLPLIPRLLDGQAARRFGLGLGVIALLGWGAAQVSGTRGQMIFAGIGLGALLLGLPVFLRRQISPQPILSISGGLAFAVFLLILVRIENAGSGPLPGDRSLVVTAAILAFGLVELTQWTRTPDLVPEADAAGAKNRSWETAAAWLGLSTALTLLYFGFTSPVVVARWGEIPYPYALGLSGLVLAAFLLILFTYPVRIAPNILIAWNGLFVLMLSAALLLHQVPMPADPGAYPIAARQTGPPALLALVLTVFLHPVLYLDAALLAGKIQSGHANLVSLAAGAAASALLQFILIFGHVFTTVYDYIPIAGPWFRDRFWLVYAIPGVILLAVTVLCREGFSTGPVSHQRRLQLASTGVMLVLALAGAFSANQAQPPQPAGSALTVMTYNIQQGYRQDGEKGWRDQLALIKAFNPDILGIQESDTARIANGNVDVVGYLSARLNMHQYYGPNPVTGTFGIALLSRYPIQNPRTYYLYSKGEQTAVILAEIQAIGGTYTVMVTHLGNRGPQVQIEQVLSLVPGRDNVLLMGDFNFHPGTQQYATTTSLLQDSWLLADVQEMTPAGQDTASRIDHIFLSPGLKVQQATYIGKGASDHPGMVVSLAP